jgi:hypothetical protein
MTLREQLVAAFEAGDHLTIRRLGWWPVWEAANTWNAPRQTCTAQEFVPFAKLLGYEDPVAVLDAFEALAGEWRPTPAQIKDWLNAGRMNASRVDVGGGRNLTETPEALQAVDAAIRAGEQPCSCGVRSPQWRRDDANVLRCPTCGGLDHGQVYAVEDRDRSQEAA